MPTAAYSSLVITDGTTVATLTDGTNYQLIDGGWGPNVAPLRVSTLGGSGPYADVVEQITVNVRGSTGAVCLANLAKLSQLLDQAERWARGESVTAVLLTCQPQGSTLSAALSCAILGRAGESAINTPATFNDFLMCYEIPNVQLSFRRRGLWLAAEESVGPTTAAETATIQTVTFSSAATIMNPIKLVLAGLSATYTTQFNGFVLIAKTGSISMVEAEGLTGTFFSVVADSAKVARGGYVLRYTPTYAGSAFSAIDYAVGLPSAMRQAAIFAAVRNNSATVRWNLRAALGINGEWRYTRLTSIDTSSTTARLLYLGNVALPDVAQDLLLEVSASSLSGSPTLDIDYVAVMATDDVSSRAVQIGYNYYGIDGIVIDPQALTAVSPTAYTTASALKYHPGYMGDPFVMGYGAGLDVVVLAAPGDWRYSNLSGAAKTTVTATRRLAYLTPQ